MTRPRVDLPELVGREVPALERARPEVLDEHVALGHEAAQQVLALLHAKVERDELLVARLHGPPQAAALEVAAAPVAQRVAAIGRLDLDDLGAEVAEDPADERAGEEDAELDDAHAEQRSLLDRAAVSAAAWAAGLSVIFACLLRPCGS